MTMIRIDPGDGIEEEVQMHQLRKGDFFYVLDGGNKGPLLLAEEDASLRRHPTKPKDIWGCKSGFAPFFV